MLTEALADSGKYAVFGDRGVLRVGGADAAKLLGGIITNDMSRLEREPAIYAGLLSPQGKILFDLFIMGASDGFLIDVAREKVGELAKRISMYKLRAEVTIADVSEDYEVIAAWGLNRLEDEPSVFSDPREPSLSSRAVLPRSVWSGLHGKLRALSGDWHQSEAAEYHARRVRHGVPEGGKDWDFGDTFPHEALFDQLNGVSFKKGCYVGQETVSRMEHRGTARKRVVQVVAESALPEGRPDVLVGDVAIGKLGSVADRRGLALLRLDRVAEAQEKGQSITAGGIPLRVELPAFATFKMEISRS
ncbi:MAG: folate-binding protein [Hyphomicrobium sp.]|jgi:hypothetical protein